ncbi:LysR family transcriptional regulator [Lactobacillus johnsonii]|uniref:LysR family transcriptional regulator n=1 Tax=Lactobacillus johnsonii TaxID=33959 RepID=UPI0028E910B8|nr:LysR family transcriptional regulator [Lactobacillus johnsonii]MDT9606381.1 LysR family transcriptional regulator [Lactobacillus johnsonii]
MDNQLKTFIAVADNRSFNKAANELFISTPAVIKQINNLEENIKIKLFKRTHNGVSLTKAGQSFYKDAIKLLDAFNQSINRAKGITEKQVIKIGAGPLASGISTNNIWVSVGKENPKLSFQFIPCACAFGDFNEFLDGIGKCFDIVSSIYNPKILEKYKLDAFQLDTVPLKLSIPITNPLVKKEKLTLNDLNDQTVLLPMEGKFSSFDKVRNFLNRNPTIKIKDISNFDINVLNQCANNNWLICSVDDWQTAHPLLQPKKIAWSYTVPFGILYRKNKTRVVDTVLQFLEKNKATQ